MLTKFTEVVTVYNYTSIGDHAVNSPLLILPQHQERKKSPNVYVLDNNRKFHQDKLVQGCQLLCIYNFVFFSYLLFTYVLGMSLTGYTEKWQLNERPQNYRSKSPTLKEFPKILEMQSQPSSRLNLMTLKSF